MTDFEREYNRLNPAQRRAVSHTEGPLLVIAGPGTGKTQLLSLRVANILKQTDVSHENILCLTFTNKAANNMRERLTSLVGPAGNRVPIRTFHSFAAELMTLYPDYFWNGARLTHVPDAVQLEIITNILSELPLNNPLALKFAGAFTAVGDVQDGLRLAKEAGLTPDKLRSLITLNLRYIDVVEPALIDICAQRLHYKKLDELEEQLGRIADQSIDVQTRPLVSLATVIRESFAAAKTADEGTNKTTHVSRWKARWISTVNGKKGMFDERKRNHWWLALADVYEQYRSRLHERGFYDYADMIIEVITQLEQSPDMLASVQEHYQYLLIDEFQDTNAAQLRLAHLVADHHAAEGNPNIMVVGDDDQAIYKFQGAELSNMLDFKRSYPAAEVVVLTDNYRSTQAVLDFAGKLISQATERLSGKEQDIKKTLTARQKPQEPGAIEHLSFPTRQHQYYHIAKRLAETHASGQTVAVLARSHESLRTIAAILHEQQVPIRYEQQQSILEQEAVRQVVLAAQVINALSQGDISTVNEQLAKLLSHPVWGVGEEALWQLAIKNHYAHDWITSLLESDDEQLQTIAHWLLWLSRESVNQPLPRMLEYIIGLKASEHMTSPIRAYFLAPNQRGAGAPLPPPEAHPGQAQPEREKAHTGENELQGGEGGEIDTPYIAALSGVHKLLNLTQEFSRHNHATLTDFVRLIQIAGENNQVITDESLFVSAPNAVELLTVHKAKGLEFDCVFILDAQETIWRPAGRGRKPPANLPLKPTGDDLDDYIRLMFVAITRARADICIASYYTDANGQPALPSGLIRDILPARTIETGEASETRVTLERTLTWPRLEGSREKLLLKRTLEGFSLSVTAFLNFLDVSKGGPSYFLERHLLKLPEAVTPKAAFGRAIHTALEKAQQLTCDDSFTLDEVLMTYESALREQFLGPADNERYLLHGQNVLRQLFEQYHLRLTPTGRPEVKLDVSLQSARLRGDLDRVDNHDRHLLITDYKTGTPLTSLLTKNKTLQLKAWRHRTQLQFYSLLAAESRLLYEKGNKPASITAQMLYVEAESEKDLVRRYEASPAELDRLRRLIPIVWEKILSLNLPDTRHYDQSYQGAQAFEDDLLEGRV